MTEREKKKKERLSIMVFTTDIQCHDSVAAAAAELEKRVKT